MRDVLEKVYGPKPPAVYEKSRVIREYTVLQYLRDHDHAQVGFCVTAGDGYQARELKTMLGHMIGNRTLKLKVALADCVAEVRCAANHYLPFKRAERLLVRALRRRGIHPRPWQMMFVRAWAGQL